MRSSALRPSGVAGNAAGLVAAVFVGSLVHHPAAAFVLLAVFLIPGLPLVRGLAFEARTGRDAPLSARTNHGW